MPKITLLGAGSGFTQPLFTDILNIEGIKGGTIGLVDIDARRLDVNVRLMRRILDVMGKKRWKIEASTDRLDVLKGTDYLISTIEVSGLPCVKPDNDIPLKYGIDQCIGDTIGPGGIMKALRTLPAFIDILKDAERYCPDALIMNYTNPMSIMTLGAVRTTAQPFVGLCHSVQGTTRCFAKLLDRPYDEIVWKCAGINHMAWVTEFRHKGKSLYPEIRSIIEDPEVYEKDPIPFETIKAFGLFSTEGSGHYSEYVPYFRKRKDLIKKYCRAGYGGESGFYVRDWPSWRKRIDKERRDMAAGRAEIAIKRSFEYAGDIVEGHYLGRKKEIYASVPNTGLITNLPQTGVVEVEVIVDRRGFTPTYFGALPEQVAALCRSNMSVFELCAQGILDEDRESIIHAMMLDPLSAAVCSTAEIRDMAEDLFKAEKRYIPDWVVKRSSPARGSRRKPARTKKKVARKRAETEVSSMAARGH